MTRVRAGLLPLAVLGGLLAGCTPADAPRVPAPPARGLGILPAQGPPEAGCALYLYHEGRDRLLLLAADSSTGTARIMLDGAVVALPQLSFDGVPRSGFPDRMRFGTGDVAVTVELAAGSRTDMPGGAAIESASLRLDRTGADSVALPVRGVIACV